MRVEIRDLDSSEFAHLIELCKNELVVAGVEARLHSEGNAREKVDEHYEKMLPDGIATQGHVFKSIHFPGGQDSIGYLWLKRNKTNEKVYLLSYVYVAPEYRRKGIATEGLRWMDAFLEANEASDVQLNVFSSNKGAKELYSKFGFTETNARMVRVYNKASHSIRTSSAGPLESS